ncbi:hypothetical protein DEIPH_ctg103orf0046 [Deinococcus phoenicis]|uniref:Helix-turn-helix domain-containing protein n=1 Tax=Deinococcus phoenicis TaxID=1476583 RepID=A0A016QKX3_9DEIO|nr:hypothetical protein [Deinococcus phoenicis]EYB66517.1 hypothetical protein DEIPH_ctg103orf0046 [Deinococcus phoenicis]
MNGQKITPDDQRKFDPFTMPPLYIHSTMREYINTQSLTPHSLAALVWITSRTNGSRGEYYEAVGNMAAGLGMSRRKAQGVLRDLEDRGIIIGRARAGRATRYRVQPYAQWNGIMLELDEQEVPPPAQDVPWRASQMLTPVQQEPAKVSSSKGRKEWEEPQPPEPGCARRDDLGTRMLEGTAEERQAEVRAMSGLLAQAIFKDDGRAPDQATGQALDRVSQRLWRMDNSMDAAELKRVLDHIGADQYRGRVTLNGAFNKVNEYRAEAARAVPRAAPLRPADHQPTGLTFQQKAAVKRAERASVQAAKPGAAQ